MNKSYSPKKNKKYPGERADSADREVRCQQDIFDHSPVVDFCANALAPTASKKAESAAAENCMVSFNRKGMVAISQGERRIGATARELRSSRKIFLRLSAAVDCSDA
jgi:hypothetical protein